MKRVSRPATDLAKRGNSRASGYERNANDWYVEPPWIVHALLDAEPFGGDDAPPIWDPACGRGTIPRIANERGMIGFGSDLVDRGYSRFSLGTMDFLTCARRTDNHIVSNPPYGILQEFVDHALTLTTGKVAVLARLAWLEGISRREWFHGTNLSRVLVSSARVCCPPGEIAPAFDATKWPTGGAIAYAWFIWGRDHAPEPTLTILPPPPKGR